jgi:hypothetical protein
MELEFSFRGGFYNYAAPLVLEWVLNAVRTRKYHTNSSLGLLGWGAGFRGDDLGFCGRRHDFAGSIGDFAGGQQNFSGAGRGIVGTG